MPIVVNLDVVLAQRKMKSKELAEIIGIQKMKGMPPYVKKCLALIFLKF